MRPWRSVSVIHYVTGPRGGQAWLLELECGHYLAKPIPPSRPGRIRKPFEAPKRCRCLLCKTDDEQGKNHHD